MENSHRDVGYAEYGRAAYPFQVGTNESWEMNYLYDAKDMRIYKEKANEESYYLYDAAGKQVAVRETKQVSLNLETSWQYFIFGSEREAMLKTASSDSSHKYYTDEVTFYVYDHLGNTRVTHTPNKTTQFVESVIEYAAEYFPYGKTIRSYTNNAERYLTTQHERDEETGLDYRGARFYDADVARFLSLDPLANEFPSWSAYNYVMGNPIVLVDPDGREAESTHLDKDGKLIAVINDGDNSIYQHGDNADGSTPTPYMISKRQDIFGSTSANGTKIGSTTTWDEYLNTDLAQRGNIKTVEVSQNKDQGMFEDPNFPGVIFIPSESMGYGGGMTIGHLIWIGSKDLDPKELLDLKRHEYGHYLQFLSTGGDLNYSAYLSFIGIPSLISTAGDGDHQKSWTETDANRRSYEFFGKPKDWNPQFHLK